MPDIHKCRSLLFETGTTGDTALAEIRFMKFRLQRHNCVQHLFSRVQSPMSRPSASACTKQQVCRTWNTTYPAALSVGHMQASRSQCSIDRQPAGSVRASVIYRHMGRPWLSSMHILRSLACVPYATSAKNRKRLLSVTFIDPSILRVLVEAVRPRHYWWNATSPHLASSHKCGPRVTGFRWAACPT